MPDSDWNHHQFHQSTQYHVVPQAHKDLHLKETHAKSSKVKTKQRKKKKQQHHIQQPTSKGSMSKCTYRSILPQLSFLLLSDGHIQQVDIGLIVHLRELHSCFRLHLMDKNTTHSPLADLYILQTLQTNQNKCLGIRNKFTTFSLALARCMGAAAFQPWLISFAVLGQTILHFLVWLLSW